MSQINRISFDYLFEQAEVEQSYEQPHDLQKLLDIINDKLLNLFEIVPYESDYKSNLPDIYQNYHQLLQDFISIYYVGEQTQKQLSPNLKFHIKALNSLQSISKSNDAKQSPLYQMLLRRVQYKKQMEQIKKKFWLILQDIFPTQKQQKNDDKKQKISQESLQMRSHLENIFNSHQRLYLFKDDPVDYGWTSLLCELIPQNLLLDLPNPIKFKKEDANFILVQLRYLLKQTQGGQSQTFHQKQASQFILQLLQQLSHLSEFHMKLYFVLSEKGKNSLCMHSGLSGDLMQIKQCNDLDSYKIVRESVGNALYLKADQENTLYFDKVNSNKTKQKFPNLLSVVQKFKLKKKNNIYERDKNGIQKDCDNLIRDQFIRRITLRESYNSSKININQNNLKNYQKIIQ